MKKYFIEVMFADESLAAITKDGQLYRFPRTEETLQKLKINRLPKDKEGIYFNDTLDRYCAEFRSSTIMVNPAIITSSLGLPIAFGNECD